jgi:hypothetical protein
VAATVIGPEHRRRMAGPLARPLTAQVIFAGCRELPRGSGDERAVGPALAAVGVELHWAAWGRPERRFQCRRSRGASGHLGLRAASGRFPRVVRLRADATQFGGRGAVEHPQALPAGPCRCRCADSADRACASRRQPALACGRVRGETRRRSRVGGGSPIRTAPARSCGRTPRRPARGGVGRR